MARGPIPTARYPQRSWPMSNLRPAQDDLRAELEARTRLQPTVTSGSFEGLRTADVEKVFNVCTRTILNEISRVPAACCVVRRCRPARRCAAASTSCSTDTRSGPLGQAPSPTIAPWCMGHLEIDDKSTRRRQRCRPAHCSAELGLRQQRPSRCGSPSSHCQKKPVATTPLKGILAPHRIR